MKTSSLFMSGAIASTAAALQATTTRYFDGQEGACGCGNNSNFGWQAGISSGVYTAAGSQALYDSAGGSWCGNGCGHCYQLTSTGTAPSGQGTGGAAGQSIIVMVTNLCPNNGNAVWCPNVGGTNQYGYSYHFDIMAQNEVLGDNPIVNFEQVACPGAATSDFGQCHCPMGSGGVGSIGSGNPPPASSTTASVMRTSTTTVGRTTQTTTAKTTTSANTGGGGGVAPKWGQCGGTGYTGPTACASGSTCTFSNPYYSQCL